MRPPKEVLRRRAIPLLQLMIAEGEYTLAIKNLVNDLMLSDEIDVAAAYDRLIDAGRERDKKIERRIEQVLEMLFHETGIVNTDHNYGQWKRKQGHRRAEAARKARHDQAT